MSSLRNQIEKELLTQFKPEQLTVTDDSHQHRGHPGAKAGGHFSVRIVSSALAHKTPIERHRMIYHALSAWMKDIHALQIHASSPDENLAIDPKDGL